MDLLFFLPAVGAPCVMLQKYLACQAEASLLLQERAVDLLYFLPAVGAPLLRAVEELCLGPAYPAALGARAVDVLAARAAAGFMNPDADPSPDPEAFAALLAALLVGRPGSGAAEHPGLSAGLRFGPAESTGAADGRAGSACWARAAAVVGAACAALSGCAKPGALTHAHTWCF